MHRVRCRNLLLATLVASLAFTTPARAGIWESVLVGLGEAGFQFVGERNLLSGGADMLVSREFTGETLDFGATQLTLAGTPTFAMSTGGRGLQVLDFSLNTGNAPLSYVLTMDSGNQVTAVSGTLFADITGAINSFGYYDLLVNVSSRQTIFNGGRFVDDVREDDFDIGPISLQGNIFADLLATATDPVFDLLGVDNIFASFSGAAVFEAKLSSQAQHAAAKARAGMTLSADEIAALASASSLGAALGLEIPDLSFLNDALIEQPVSVLTGTASGAEAPLVVPEPAAIVLFMLAAPLLFRRRRLR